MGKRIGIVIGDGASEEEALTNSEFAKGGLAVNQWPPGIFNNWTVTHIASGYAVGKNGESRKQATAALRDLLPLTDWSRPIAEMREDLQLLSGQIKRVVEKNGLAFMTGHPGKHSVLARKKR